MFCIFQTLIMKVLMNYKNFNLFLFDFDGLLVDTEYLHYLAYKKMFLEKSFFLDWSFEKYCSIAHVSSEFFKEKIYKKFPLLYEKEKDWEKLKELKLLVYIKMLEENKICLMPGVKNFLYILKKENKRSCVVTNSYKNTTDVIRKKNKILNFIDFWVTREDYNLAKPNPESYLLAIDKYGKKEDKIIGFEDSVKGFLALKKTRAVPILISKDPYEKKLGKIVHFISFEDFLVSSK